MRGPGNLVNTRPLRTNPPFRRVWIGTTAASIGGQAAVVAVLVQVWETTASSVWVGAVGLATAAPTLIAGVIGGTLADAVDRRRLALVTSAVAVVAALSLAVQAAISPAGVVLVLALVVLQTGAAALGAPARRTFIPRLLPREQVSAGVALNHLSFQGAMLVGPALGGVAIASLGLRGAYALDAVAILLSLYGVARLPAMPPQHAGGPPVRLGAGMRATFSGWAFVAGRPVLRGSLLVDLAATVLAMPVALFPALNTQRFDGDPQSLGLFLTAIAAGGIAAGALSGAVIRLHRPGAVMLVGAAVWGLALTAFALVDGLLATLTSLAIAGAADTVSVISRGTIVQLATPDDRLGRVSALEGVIGTAGPSLGNARAGALAGLTSATTSATIGGITTVAAIALIAMFTPALRTWRDHDTGSSGQHPNGKVCRRRPRFGRAKPKPTD